jgi:hypothetical protein
MRLLKLARSATVAGLSTVELRVIGSSPRDVSNSHPHQMSHAQPALGRKLKRSALLFSREFDF